MLLDEYPELREALGRMGPRQRSFCNKYIQVVDEVLEQITVAGIGNLFIGIVSSVLFLVCLLLMVPALAIIYVICSVLDECSKKDTDT